MYCFSCDKVIRPHGSRVHFNKHISYVGTLYSIYSILLLYLLFFADFHCLGLCSIQDFRLFERSRTWNHRKTNIIT